MPTLRMKYLSVLIIGVLCTNLAQAQLLRGLRDRVVDAIGDRAEQRAEERAAQEAEQAEQAAAESASDAENSAAPVAGNRNAAPAAGGRGADTSLFGRMLDTSNVTVRDEYSFDIAVTLEMLSFDSRGRPAGDPVEMVLHYAEDAPYTGTRMVGGEGAEAGAAMMIFDFDNKVMLMLMESDGSRFAIPTNWDISAEEWNEGWDLSEDEGGTAADFDFERIGTRRINGYEAEGYRFRSEDQLSEVWVSDDVAPGIGRIFQSSDSTSLFGNAMPAGYPQGMVMEMNSENTRTGEKMQMRATDIDTDADISYRMSDYPVMNLGAMGGMGR